MEARSKEANKTTVSHKEQKKKKAELQYKQTTAEEDKEV